MSNEIVLSQILSFAPKREFRRCVEQFEGNHNVRTFRCWDQFVCMVVVQLGKKESLREIETCLRAMRPLLYRAGVRGTISRNTLAYANENRPADIYRTFCNILITKARSLYKDEYFFKDLDNLVYVIDSTVISLSLSLCPWANNGRCPAIGVKLHTQLDLNGPIPSFLHISKAKMRDNHFLDSILIEPGAFYVMDKGYFDLHRLYQINNKRGYFVIRPLKHVKFQRVKSIQKEKSSAIKSDYFVRCTGRVGSRKYPDQLRKIRYLDEATGKYFTFVTNNFDLQAQTIADLYKARWQVELFFRWIKQNLRLDYFLGRSFNAIQIQIWTAVASFLLVAIAKKNLAIEAPLTEIIRFLPSALFLEMPLNKAFIKESYNSCEVLSDPSSNQLILL